eukprot:14389200-Alexandrium_andersonii.AAC.1
MITRSQGDAARGPASVPCARFDAQVYQQGATDQSRWHVGISNARVLMCLILVSSLRSRGVWASMRQAR